MALKVEQEKGALPSGFAALLTLLVALLVSASVLIPRAGARTHGHIYWATNGGENAGDIGRANLDGTGVTPNFLSFPGTFLTHSPEFSPHDIAVGAGYIYWANWGDLIGRAKLNRTHVDGSFLRIQGGALGYLALKGRHIY